MTRETTKQAIKIGSIVFVILIIVCYAYLTSRSFFNGPIIVVKEINSDQFPATVQVPNNTKNVLYASVSTSTATITGVALRIQSINLNGNPINIDESGNFSQIVALFPGYNVETISGKDAFGHTTSVELDINRN